MASFIWLLSNVKARSISSNSSLWASVRVLSGSTRYNIQSKHGKLWMLVDQERVLLRNYIQPNWKHNNESTLLLPPACVEPDSFSCSGLFDVGNEGGIHLRKENYICLRYTLLLMTHSIHTQHRQTKQSTNVLYFLIFFTVIKNII